jgi:hypothetical protein
MLTTLGEDATLLLQLVDSNGFQRKAPADGFTPILDPQVKATSYFNAVLDQKRPA